MLIALKSFLFSVVIVVMALFSILVVENLDSLFGLPNFQSVFSIATGVAFLFLGIVLRIWSAYIFYKNRLKVIVLKPQHTLVKVGPYKFSRNPLYIGIVSIVFGIALVFGSPSSIIFSFLVFIGWDVYVRFHEEKTLEKRFGERYFQYKRQVARWLRL